MRFSDVFNLPAQSSGGKLRPISDCQRRDGQAGPGAMALLTTSLLQRAAEYGEHAIGKNSNSKKRIVMRISISHRQGSILVVLLILSALMGLMLAAYLNMVGSQNRFTQRSQVWNNVMPVCEAGVEEAMAHINYSGTTSNFAINGWVLSNTNYIKSRVNGDTKCEMKISGDIQPVITVKGSIQAPVQTNYISRRVQVKTKFNFRFPEAVLAKGPVALGGNAVVDSFNSADVLYSTLGQYDPLKAGDNATVATNSKQPGNIS